MSTVGEFLREKGENMAVWLRSEGYDMQVPMSDFIVVALAHTLHNTYGNAIEARDFSALDVPEVTPLVEFVQARAHMHDKFWRYLALFSEVASRTNE